MTEERLIDIEIRLEYQDRLISQLNDALVEQHKQISELTRDIGLLKTKIAAQELGFGPANEKPPHY